MTSIQPGDVVCQRTYHQGGVSFHYGVVRSVGWKYVHVAAHGREPIESWPLKEAHRPVEVVPPEEYTQSLRNLLGDLMPERTTHDNDR